MPVLEAVILWKRGRAEDALTALRPAAPYERGAVAALLPIYFRGLIRLSLDRPAEAAADFRMVLEHRGADPFSPAVPLSYLNLAKALAATGDAEGSRRAQAALSEIWKDADAEILAALGVRIQTAARSSQAGAR
jgi:hypothetical protein